MYADRFQVAIYRDVGTMANQDIPHTTVSEDGTHLTIVDAASHTTRPALDIDTLVVEGNTASIPEHYTVRNGSRCDNRR